MLPSNLQPLKERKRPVFGLTPRDGSIGWVVLAGQAAVEVIAHSAADAARYARTLPTDLDPSAR